MTTRCRRMSSPAEFYTDADAELRERNKAFLDKKSGGHVDTDHDP